VTLAGGLVLGIVLAAGEPYAPKLDQRRGPAPGGSADIEPARRLPATVAVCVDRAAGRCWTVAGTETACGGATVFRVVVAADAAGAVARCREELAEGRGPPR
jgi:hypothetical protein